MLRSRVSKVDPVYIARNIFPGTSFIRGPLTAAHAQRRPAGPDKVISQGHQSGSRSPVGVRGQRVVGYKVSRQGLDGSRTCTLSQQMYLQILRYNTLQTWPFHIAHPILAFTAYKQVRLDKKITF